MTTKIAYFINQYPKVSHSFIRREILALERLGFEIQRIALRGWDEAVVDEEDILEREKTRYILREGILPLIFAVIRNLLLAPTRFLSALALTLRMSRGSGRSLLYHLVYLAEACRMLPWLRSSNATHVHAHFGTNSTEVVMLASELGGPTYSFTVHTDEYEKQSIDEKVGRAAFVVAISSYGRSQLYRWVTPTQWPKIHVIHCGLESSFHLGTNEPIVSGPRLVCVGRLCPQKGQVLLIEAMHRLANKGIHCELILAGDGETRPYLEALIARYGLTKQISITGWISSNRVREEILSSRGLVLPSFIEGLPVVLMEAMSLRRPVLTTYIAGIPELVVPGKNGWLFPAGDIDALVFAIEDFLARSTDELAAMGEAAHQRVIERHSIDTEAAKLAQLFRQPYA